MGEQQDLHAGRQTLEHLDGSTSTVIVKVDENIVEHQRQGLGVLEIALETGKPECKVQVVSRSLVEAVDSHLEVVLTYRDQAAFLTPNA